MTQFPTKEAIIEAMARAIILESGLDPDDQRCNPGKKLWESSKGEAQAALNALLKIMPEGDKHPSFAPKYSEHYYNELKKMGE